MSAENIISDEPQEQLIPVNGMAVVDVSEDKLVASLYITEERDGGDPVTYDDVVKEVESKGISYNVEYSAINQLLEERRYGKKIRISKGFLPTHGKDGHIEYLFETNNELVPKKGKLGEVDFKDLGLVRNITEGELIARITMPEDGMDGMNIFGQPMPPINGKPAKYTVGAGTVLSADESEISAAVSGNLVWQKDGFIIQETLVLNENVDVGTGNIDFLGNVHVKGNVCENFIVKSKKNVIVAGSVTGATIIADGDVTINLGSIHSDIIAQGDVKITFCESSKIECQGNLTCQSVIGGETYCGGAINLTGGRGVMVGGKHTALTGFVANIVGAASYTKTYVTLGSSAILTEEKLELTAKIKDLEDRIKKLLQVSELLQQHKKTHGQLPPDREAMLTTAIRSRFTFQREIKQLNERIRDIDDELDLVGDQAVVINKEIFPGVVVRVGTELLIVDRQLTKVLIGKDGEGHLTYLPFTTTTAKPAT